SADAMAVAAKSFEMDVMKGFPLVKPLMFFVSTRVFPRSVFLLRPSHSPFLGVRRPASCLDCDGFCVAIRLQFQLTHV
ncbi:MAG: hypothetical protein ACT6U0_20565, partial [Shinella sp.]